MQNLDRPRSAQQTISWAAAAAALVGLSAALTVAQHRSVERRNPPRGRKRSVRSRRLHTLEQGSGSPMLLIHGNGVTAEDWRSSGLFDALAQRHHVIAPDRPGCGYSTQHTRALPMEAQADLMAELLEQRAAEPAVVVAQSIGVQAALYLAARRPDLVRGLVLISGYAFPTARMDAAFSALGVIPGAGAFWRNTLAGPLGRAIWGLVELRMFGLAGAPRGYGRGPFDMGMRPGQLRASYKAAADMAGEARKLGPLLHSISAPTIVIAGSQDLLVNPAKQSRRLAETIPGARYFEIPHAGHMAHHAAPGVVFSAASELAGPRMAKAGAPSSHSKRAAMA